MDPILTDIDGVDWAKLRHSYGVATDVPGLFRDLLEADLDHWQAACGALFNQIFHQADIMSATAATIPFLIRYIDRCPPVKLETYLLTLQIMTEACSKRLGNPQAIYERATFQHLASGYPYYLRLLSHEKVGIRYIIAHLLGYLVIEESATLRIHLWRAARHESHPHVHWEMLRSISNLLTPFSLGNCLHERYRLLFEQITLTDENDLVRFAAATGLLHISRYRKVLPFTVVKSLVEAVQGNIDLDWDFHYVFHYDPLHDLRRLNLDELAIGLTIDELTPEGAHYIAREMLDKVFPRERTNDPKRQQDPKLPNWNQYLTGTDTTSHNVLTYSVSKNPAIIPSITKRLYVLQKILACEPFWQLPTNLLSYIYDLPDDRDAFGAYIAELEAAR